MSLYLLCSGFELTEHRRQVACSLLCLLFLLHVVLDYWLVYATNSLPFSLTLFLVCLLALCLLALSFDIQPFWACGQLCLDYFWAAGQSFSRLGYLIWKLFGSQSIALH